MFNSVPLLAGKLEKGGRLDIDSDIYSNKNFL